MEGRAPGTPGSDRARRFIEAELRDAGVQAFDGAYRRSFTWSGGSGENLVGWIPGRTDPDRYVALTAHFDHLGVRDGEIYNGADDNASGTAAVLTLAQVLTAEPLEHSVLVALVDAEEEGERGSRALVAEPPVELSAILLDVNLDMVSRTAGVLWAGGSYVTPDLAPVLERVAASAPLTLRLGHDRPNAPEGDDWTEQSDHFAFHEVGIPWVYFGVEDHPDYHRPTDDFERVDPGEYVASVRTILAALRALDAAAPFGEGAAPR